MPRYYFHLRQGDQMLQDIEGQELRDADEAWEAVKAAAASLMRHKFEGSVNWAETVFEVQVEAAINERARKDVYRIPRPQVRAKADTGTKPIR